MSTPLDSITDPWELLDKVASARCRATAPMAFAWPLRRAMRT